MLTLIKQNFIELSIMLKLQKKKKVRESQGSATITNRSPSQTPRGRGNRQNQTSAHRTNVRKAPRLALSSPSEVIAMQKGLKTQEQNNTRQDIKQIASKTTKQQRVRLIPGPPT